MMDGIEQFGNLLNQRTKEVLNGNQKLSVGLGRINSDLSLAVDGMEGHVPKGQYMLSRHLTFPETIDTAAASGHSHEVKTGLRGLKSGDRVLIAWAGNEPVIIDIILGS